MTNTQREDLLRRLKFHERKMNDRFTPEYWRKKSEAMYWHYLDELTSPEK